MLVSCVACRYWTCMISFRLTIRTAVCGSRDSPSPTIKTSGIHRNWKSLWYLTPTTTRVGTDSIIWHGSVHGAVWGVSRLCSWDHLYVNLRRSRDCLWVSVRSGVVSYAPLHLLILGKCYAVHIKRIVTITKVYIARNSIHVEMIRFHKN